MALEELPRSATEAATDENEGHEDAPGNVRAKCHGQEKESETCSLQKRRHIEGLGGPSVKRDLISLQKRPNITSKRPTNLQKRRHIEGLGRPRLRENTDNCVLMMAP